MIQNYVPINIGQDEVEFAGALYITHEGLTK